MNARRLLLLLNFAIFEVLIFASPGLAEDIAGSLQRHRQVIENLQDDVWSSQRRLVASTTMESRTEIAMTQLIAVDQMLESALSRLDSLEQSILFSQMVTDRQYIPRAKQMVQMNRTFTLEQSRRSVDSLERMIPRSPDGETTRLIVVARDALRSLIALVEAAPAGGDGR